MSRQTATDSQIPAPRGRVGRATALAEEIDLRSNRREWKRCFRTRETGAGVLERVCTVVEIGRSQAMVPRGGGRFDLEDSTIAVD
jgi:hypothetical protein